MNTTETIQQERRIGVLCRQLKTIENIYRDNAYVAPPEKRVPMKIPYIAYVLGMSISLCLGGAGCDHFQVGRAPGDQSAAGFALGFSSITMALYFAALLAAKVKKEAE